MDKIAGKKRQNPLFTIINNEQKRGNVIVLERQKKFKKKNMFVCCY